MPLCDCCSVSFADSVISFFDVAVAIFFLIPLFNMVAEINMQQKVTNSDLVTCYG